MNTSLIIVDDFYENPGDTRDWALNMSFGDTGNYPGTRTSPLRNDSINAALNRTLGMYGPITLEHSHHGCFQSILCDEVSWVHNDNFCDWSGIIYLTPDAPITGGTGFYKHKATGITGASEAEDSEYLRKQGPDITNWELIDTVANVYNRLVLWDSKRFHKSLDYFGTSMETSRLTQVLFFDTTEETTPYNEPTVEL